jgi:hypothetical protein
MEFLAQLRYQDPDQRVVAGIVVGRTAQDVYADFLFAKSTIGVIQPSLPQVEQ